MSGWRAVEWLLCMPARTSFKRKHDIQKVVPHIFSIHISRCPTSFRHLSSPSFWPQVRTCRRFFSIIIKFVSFWENCALGSSHCQTVLYIYICLYSREMLWNFSLIFSYRAPSLTRLTPTDLSFLASNGFQIMLWKQCWDHVVSENQQVNIMIQSLSSAMSYVQLLWFFPLCLVL